MYIARKLCLKGGPPAGFGARAAILKISNKVELLRRNQAFRETNIWNISGAGAGRRQQAGTKEEK